MRRKDIGLVVVDEGSKFRNAKTDRFRGLERVCSKPDMRVWWLTATPTPSGPDNAWAQCRIINPTAVPRFYGAFRAETMIEVAANIWKPRAGAEAIVHRAMQPAIRFAKADCLDLPPMVTVDLSCSLSDEQALAYKQMSTAMQIADAAAVEQGGVVTAVNAADRVNKLRQIMLGSCKSSATDYISFDYTPRYNVLLEAIEMAQAKVIIIVPFKGILRDLTERLSKKYSCAMINGDVSIGRRNALIKAFKEEENPRILLAHPECMSHGLNLTEADTLIFFGPMYGNDAYRQVIERYNRPPQTRRMTMVRIGCGPIEWAIYKALDGDESQQQMILSLYKSVIGTKSQTGIAA